ncbi:probable ribonuclease ZC3H12C [Hippocampus zosterae]|uniref:probable ribonuclease ZC3H12C n=1 Tax=Hippocampus zosterae TaxID=109293 RepID=UPI00223DAEE7|nr:probable ribonuclease ZC3H12C [Hippocampus zosterae]XP_051913562.1 probable ribonuclease ZC3H12C [Hippocampus zosterae]XP_051913563.1 probable ribonuclease ZC3H12C [Hippocampus zosterae]XP_051913564.1 probable ribonuclease ZC3H12C [Hippocampus zosterae]
MGQKNHAEAGPGHILDLGLEYLHVAGADRQAGSADEPPAMEDQGESDAGTTPTPLAAVAEADSCYGREGKPWASPTPRLTGDLNPHRGESGSSHSKSTHQPLCRTPCVDLGTEGPPEPPVELSSEGRRDGPALLQHPPLSQENPSNSGPAPAFADEQYQAKLGFALKLGYSEETVRLVLSKLGPRTLINDILGELVKRGSSDGEQPFGSSASTSTSSSSCSSYSSSDLPAALGLDSPCLPDPLCDQEILRPVVVDGSNVAMSHGNKEVFSCQGIQLAVDWFLERGHHDVTVFVPAWRKEQSRPDAPITDQEILRRLEKEKILVFTPSRRVQGRRVVCYDDRFIVKLAYESDGIIVSNDNYRDLANEKPEWRKFIDERLLMYSFVNDKFMPPDDPLGRHGPSLDNFLRKRPVMPEQKKQPCPYGKKCTYGHKCKYYHPERSAQPQRAVADELRASAKTCVATKNQADAGLVKSHSMPARSIEAKKGVAKRQSDPGVRALSYSDAEEKLAAKDRTESQRTGVSGAVGNCSGTASMPAVLPGGQPPCPQQDQQSRAGTLQGVPPAPSHDLYPHCESPDLSSYSAAHAYSNLRISSRQSPDSRIPHDGDLRLDSVGSAGSECGSESSTSCGSSCDSYSERPCHACQDSLVEDASYYGNSHGRLHFRPAAGSHELCSLHSADTTSVPHSKMTNPGAHGYDTSAAPGQSWDHSRSLYALPLHFPHQPFATRSSCPADYHTLAASNAPDSPLCRRVAPTRAESGSESRLYDNLCVFQHHHRTKALPTWDAYYRELPALPRYGPSAYPCPSYTCQASWHSPRWAQDGYTSRRLSHPSLHSAPSHYLSHPSAQSSLPPHLAPSSYTSQLPESPGHSRYGDAREKAYANLCNIFPSELVSRVMARSPHVTDPQQLAAAILAEKANMSY